MKARINLGQVVRRVVRKTEYFILEKDGIPVAGIMGADELEDYWSCAAVCGSQHWETLKGPPAYAPGFLRSRSTRRKVADVLTSTPR